MKRLSLFIVFAIIAFACARISSPTGGPEDETPPTLILSVPDSAQINYSGNTILLEFDEWVKTNNIESNLIVTPSLKDGFKTKVNKRSVLLTFLSLLDDSTTYTFNFGNTIQDITNNNVPPNLRLSFSTGPFIDSLEISGKVLDLYTQDPKENTLVSLYSLTDSLDITSGPASYFTRTDTAGNYKFTNLPSDQYLVYAAMDKNNNLKADTDSESYGFYLDTLDLSENIQGIDFTTQRLNTQKLRTSSRRPFGVYYDITFSRPIIDFDLRMFDSTQRVPTHMLKDPTTIRLFNPEQVYADTTDLIVTATDSLAQTITDTVSYYFNESRIKPDPFNFDLQPTSNELQAEVEFEINFTKPVKTFLKDSLYFQLDSANTLAPPDSILIWDDLRTQLKWNLNLNDHVEPGQNFELLIKPSAFISIENDSSANQTKRLKLATLEDTGLISGTVTTNASDFIIQLVNPTNLEVIQEVRNDPNYSFTFLNPSTYFVRVVHDVNGNGKWDTGNILSRTPPEPVKYYFDSFNQTKRIKIRKNWELSDININFTVDN